MAIWIQRWIIKLCDTSLLDILNLEERFWVNGVLLWVQRTKIEYCNVMPAVLALDGSHLIRLYRCPRQKRKLIWIITKVHGHWVLNWPNFCLSYCLTLNTARWKMASCTWPHLQLSWAPLVLALCWATVLLPSQTCAGSLTHGCGSTLRKPPGLGWDRMQLNVILLLPFSSCSVLITLGCRAGVGKLRSGAKCGPLLCLMF